MIGRAPGFCRVIKGVPVMVWYVVEETASPKRPCLPPAIVE